MLSQEQLLEKMVDQVATNVADAVKTVVVEAVGKALSATTQSALIENEFYRHINTEMRQGLQSIYKEITQATASPASGADTALNSEKTGKLFSEASKQLEEVMETTFEATESIMASVEDMLDRQQNIATLLVSIQDNAPEAVETLAEHNVACEEALTSIMTTLSFQDLTGQRLKKVVTALADIQDAIFEMYVSSGLMIKTRAEAPEKGIAEIAQESQKKLKEIKEIKDSELKGPSKGSNSQSDVDSLLADLGL